jgi:glycosyltransferase involved in cell wall biosynthesis
MHPLRVVYLAPADIQVARVDRQAIVYFCSALARRGVDVELIALGIKLSRAEKHRPSDALSLYRLRATFPVQVVPTRLHQESRSWLIGVTRLVVHARAAWSRVRRGDPDYPIVFYTKNYAPAAALIAMRRFDSRVRIAFEAHVPPSRRLKRSILQRADAVIANSHALAKSLARSSSVHENRLIGIHQGVDLEPYAEQVDREQLRAELSLPNDRPLAVYTGKIFSGYSEVEYILEAAGDRSVESVLFVLVGGREDHVDEIRARATRRGLKNVLLTGFVPPRTVHRYQRVADVLILYYPSAMAINAYRSPGKLFEYMASGVPIVAVDLPVLAEVLGTPPAAFLIRADAPRELARAVRAVLDEPARAASVAAMARERVTNFTWDRRAETLVEFLRRAAVPEQLAGQHEPRRRR